MSRRLDDHRIAAAFLLGLGALAAAAIAALGPAVPERAVYTWPPAQLPEAQPTRTWFTPLLLARHSAESFDARIPCGEPTTTLGGAGERVVLLATARDVAANHALGVTWSRATGVTSVRVGRNVLGRVPAGAPASCRLVVHLGGARWSIRLPDGSSRQGAFAYPPRILGLVTELDLAARPALTVTVHPYPQDTHPSARQTVLRWLTALLLAGALTLVFQPWRWPWRRALRHRVGRPTAQDGVALGVTAVWWVLAPLQDDDGWVRARQTNSLVSGGFSNYYEHWGADLPLATWYEWLQHFVMTGTDSLAVHRLPSVGLVVATWFVARWCLVDLTGRRPGRADTVWWVRRRRVRDRRHRVRDDAATGACDCAALRRGSRLLHSLSAIAELCTAGYRGTCDRPSVDDSSSRRGGPRSAARVRTPRRR